MSLPRPLRRLAAMALVAAVALSACRRDSACRVPAGEATFSLYPDEATYHALNIVGGYEYFVGGHRGVVVVRTQQDAFVAYERSCPLDTNTQVSVSADLGSAVLECPKCHSRFSTFTDGVPLQGSATPCSLFQYSTMYDGDRLYVY